MVAFYKHNIPSWRGGTAGLSDRAYRVYHVIVEEIMMQEGSFPLHERSLAGLANRSIRDCRLALAELVDAGKIKICDGRIVNERAEKELVAIHENRKNAAVGGRKTGEKSAKNPRVVDENTANTPREVGEHSTRGPREVRENSDNRSEIKGDMQAPLETPNQPKREEKRREEKKESKAQPLYPEPAPTPAATDASGSVLAGLKRGIVQAFAQAGSMTLAIDTHRAAIWIEQGFRPGLILSVITEQLSRKPHVRNLSYFDNAIAEAHAKSAPKAVASAAGSDTAKPVLVHCGGHFPIPESFVIEAVDHWRRDPSDWDDKFKDRFGPAPDHESTFIPAKYREGIATRSRRRSA